MLDEYKAFLATIRKLTREEEAVLWKQYKEEGLLEARQSLIEHYQPLVFREAMKYGLQEAVTLDLIQEGTVGLMEAVEKYNPLPGRRLFSLCPAPGAGADGGFPAGEWKRSSSGQGRGRGLPHGNGA